MQNMNESMMKGWLADVGRIEADAAFRRARRRVMLGMVKNTLSRRTGTCAAEAGETATREGASIPLDSITGYMDGNGREVGRIPLLKRSALAEWRRVYCADSDEAHPPLKVRRGHLGWYLTEGTAALVILEVARAKGKKTVRVLPDRKPGEDLCAAAAESAGCKERCEELHGMAS